MPDPERILWSRLRGKQLNGHKFRRQYGVGEYILDFYCVTARLAIELDGDTHYVDGGQDRDRIRDAFLRKAGIKVLRFTNREIRENMDGVLQTIQNLIQGSKTPSISPL